MAKRNGLRIFVLTLVGAATVVCLVFTGLLVRLAIRTLNTSDEQITARNEKQEEVNQAFAEAFGSTDDPEGGIGEIEINLGGGIPAPGGGIPAPPTVVETTPPASEETTPAESAAVVASASQTITLDVDAEGKVSYEGQQLNETSLVELLDSIDDDSKVVLDVHPGCDEEMAQLWQFIIFQNGFTPTTQRVADLPQ